MQTSKEHYEKRKKHYQQRLAKHTQLYNLLSNLRLIVFVLGAGIAVFLYLNQSRYLSGGVFLITLASFMALVVKHTQAANNKRYFSVLYEINDNALKRLSGEWKSFYDTGEEFLDKDHNYTEDLDIFGKGSLFQWINTANTYLGRLKLKEALAAPSAGIADIYKRQEAVKELADKLDWRQNLAAEGMQISGQAGDPKALFSWAKERNAFYAKKWVRTVSRLLPAFTITLIMVSLVNTQISYQWPLLAAGVQAIMLQLGKKERARSFAAVNHYKNSIKIYRGMLKLFETEKFKSGYLKDLQNNMRYQGKDTAYEQVTKLEQISEWISNRYNMFYTIVNIITLWDYQCMIALEEWKRRSGSLLKEWVLAIAEVEALSSLAVISYDHPHWAVPKIVEGPPVFSAQEMGHPLLTGGRVCNDLQIAAPATILLITGSNMSGKSTLLRTAGINLVLAYAGAPVCAKALCCSMMNIYTSMRVSDNLETNISSFYAELLRIKRVVEAAKAGQQVFLLLDEIFKGTNSKDRHTGAKVLIQQLSQNGALGLVSTHDLELGELEEESKGKIKNYHFREYYQNDELLFDYKLRPGISTTRNALYLIKLAGIEVKD